MINSHSSLFVSRSSHRRRSIKKGVLKKKKPVWESLFQVLRYADLLKEIPTQVFPCKICQIFKNTYFEEHP